MLKLSAARIFVGTALLSQAHRREMLSSNEHLSVGCVCSSNGIYWCRLLLSRHPNYQLNQFNWHGSEQINFKRCCFCETVTLAQLHSCERCDTVEGVRRFQWPDVLYGPSEKCELVICIQSICESRLIRIDGSY